MSDMNNIANPIAPSGWTYEDQQSPYTRILGTASGMESMGTGLRMAALSLHDPQALADALSGAGDLFAQLAAVLVAQASRMEDCPRCSHATQPLEVREPLEQLEPNDGASPLHLVPGEK